MARSLEDVIQEAGSPVNLLWESKTPPAVVPRVVPEFTNWRTEQLAWRRTAVLFDQSHHMADLNIKGPDALRLIERLAVNSVANFAVEMATNRQAFVKEIAILPWMLLKEHRGLIEKAEAALALALGEN